MCHFYSASITGLILPTSPSFLNTRTLYVVQVAFRFPSHSCKEMPEQTIISFYRESFLLRLYVFLFRNYAFVWFPIIAGYIIHFVLFYLFPKLFCCFVTPVANNEIDESLSISINSNPYPTVVFFEPI